MHSSSIVLQIPANPKLSDLQDYVSKVEEARGFDSQDAIRKCLLLGEEIGELFKAVREAEGLGKEVGSPPLSVKEELADVLIFTCAIANRFGIDLEQAFLEKSQKNASRNWS